MYRFLLLLESKQAKNVLPHTVMVTELLLQKQTKQQQRVHSASINASAAQVFIMWL